LNCPHDIRQSDPPQLGLCSIGLRQCKCAEAISDWLIDPRGESPERPPEVRWWEEHGDL
jgi:hypothetical protein